MLLDCFSSICIPMFLLSFIHSFSSSVIAILMHTMVYLNPILAYISSGATFASLWRSVSPFVSNPPASHVLIDIDAFLQQFSHCNLNAYYGISEPHFSLHKLRSNICFSLQICQSICFIFPGFPIPCSHDLNVIYAFLQQFSHCNLNKL